MQDERALVAALRAGDEATFMRLVEDWHAGMVRVAGAYVPSRAVAEEVAQETWLAVLNGIGRFEERSSLRTWVFRILANRAKTRGERERRSVPFSALASAEAGRDEPAVDPDRFLPADHERIPGHWNTADGRGPRTLPEERLLEREALQALQRSIASLPEAQRTVISLRDVEGWEPEEVCELLGISDGNQRVLLHRARSRVRAELEELLA